MGHRHLTVGTVVAEKYRLLERLGGGGMGDVYRADHELAGRTVAIKLLRRDLAEDEDLTRRFFQEARSANRIRHPNIVDVLDAGFSEHGPYVVMEYLEGANLGAILAAATRLSPDAALAVIFPMLAALEAAHAFGIVHRDLKPENVYLTKTGTHGIGIKLLDFGIAKVLDTSGRPSPQTHTGVIFGTPDYLSPEQASGGGVVDGRSDVFAVGTVLFELLSGRRPFEAQSPLATAYKVVHAEAPRLTDFDVIVEARFQDALDLALAKEAEKRFPGAAAFAEYLAPLAFNEGGAVEELRRRLDEVVASNVESKSLAELDERTKLGAQPTEKPPPQNLAPPVDFRVPTPTPSILLEPRAKDPYASISPPTLPSGHLPSAETVARAVQSAKAPATPRRGEWAADRTSSRMTAVVPSPSSSKMPVATPKTSRFESVTPLADAARARLIATEAPTSSARQNMTTSVRPAVPSVSVPRSRIPFVPRALPAHTRGISHTRGTFPRSVGRWIERKYGGAGRNDVLQLLPFDIAESFRADTFNALVWYDLEALDSFLEAGTATVIGGDPRGWRTLARDNFDRDFGPIIRPSQRVTDVPTLLKRFPAGWGKLVDFGIVRIAEPQGTRVVIRVEGFDAASLAFREVLVGTLEGLVRSACFGDVSARFLFGESSFARDLEFEIAWVA